MKLTRFRDRLRDRETPASIAVLVVFAGVVMLLYWPAISGGKTQLHGDSVGHGLILLDMLRDFFYQGDNLLWTDKVYGGHPIFAESQGGFLNPINIIIALSFEPITGLNLYHVLSMFISGIGVFLLSRCLGSSYMAAGFACFAAVFSVFWIEAQANITVSGTIAWIPWVVYSFEAWVRKPGLRSGFLFGLFASLLVLAGYPPLFYGTVLYVSLTLLVVPFQKQARALWLGSLGPRVASGLFAIAVCVGLTAVQWMPMLELVGESARQDGTTLVEMPPIWNFMYDDTNWDNRLAGLMLLGSSYVLCLSLLALFVPVSDRIKGHFLATFVLFNLGIANDSPIFRFIYEHNLLPGIHSFRVMFIFLHIYILGAAVLAAAGVDGLVRTIREKSWQRARAFTAILRLLLCVVAVAWLFRSMTLQEMLVPENIFLAAALLIIVTAYKTGATRWLPHMLALLLVFEVVIFKSRAIGFHDRAWLDKPDTVQWLEAQNMNSRLYKVRNLSPVSMYAFLHSTDPALGKGVAAALSAASASSNLLWNIASPNGSFGLPLARMDLALARYNVEYGDTAATPGQRLIDLLGHRYAMTPTPLALPGFSEVYSSSATGVVVNENSAARPRIQGYSRHTVVTGPDEVFTKLEHREPDTLIVESRALGGESVLPDSESSKGTNNSCAISIEVLEARAGRYRLDVDAGSDGWVFVADAPYPDWKAEVDGESRPVFPANILGKAVPVVAGRHIVELYYAPDPFSVGRAISLGSIALLFALYLICRRRGLTTPGPENPISRFRPPPGTIP